MKSGEQRSNKHGNISIFIPHLGCPFKCSFCAQNDISGTAKAPTAEEVREIIKTAYDRTSPEERLNMEVAFFGGSFTAIPKEYMTALLTAAKPYINPFCEDGFKGIRISTRPDCIDDDILTILRESGVTAIELGAQSMNDSVLGLNNRGHSADDIRRSAGLIKAYGFETGLQMMTGLYGSSPEDDLYTAKEFIKLSPDTVRIYPTVIIKGTELGRLYEQGEYIPYPFEECIDVCAAAYEKFTENNIRIIRLGLHAERSLEEKMIGGYYHPAMGELVRGRIFRNRLERILNGQTAEARVPRRLISIAAGHKNANKAYFGDKVIFIPVDMAADQAEIILSDRIVKYIGII